MSPNPNTNSPADCGPWETAAVIVWRLRSIGHFASQWNADKEIQALLLKETSVSANGTPKPGRYSRKQAADLLAHHFDTDAILKRKLPYERLDQLTVDIRAGVR